MTIGLPSAVLTWMLSFSNPVHSQCFHCWSGGCVSVCSHLERVCAPDKRSISMQSLWSLSLLCRPLKGGACLRLAGPGLAPWNGHLALNGGPVLLCMSQLPARKLFQLVLSWLVHCFVEAFSCIFLGNKCLKKKWKFWICIVILGFALKGRYLA